MATGVEMMISAVLKALKINVNAEEMQRCKDVAMQFIGEAPAMVKQLQDFQVNVLARLQMLETAVGVNSVSHEELVMRVTSVGNAIEANHHDLKDFIAQQVGDTRPAGGTLDYADDPAVLEQMREINGGSLVARTIPKE